MAFFDDVKYNLLKISKKIVDKTGDYSRIARLTLDIKNYESDIEKKLSEIGKIVIEKMEAGNDSLDLKETALTDIRGKIKTLESDIKSNREEIERLKKPQKEEKKEKEEKEENQENTGEEKKTE